MLFMMNNYQRKYQMKNFAIMIYELSPAIKKNKTLSSGASETLLRALFDV